MKLKRTAAIIITIGLIFGALFYATDLFELKSSDFKHQAFFDENKDFDVLFLGTSHVLNGIFPMELWKDYGFTSYNMGGHGSGLATSYWVYELALKYTTPSLVVIDCLGLQSNFKTATTYSYVHISFDAFPLSLTKVRAVYDLLNDDAMDAAIEEGTVEVTEERIPISLLWDFSVYHSRWSELEADDFNPSYGVEKGAESRIGVAVPREILEVSPDTKLEENTVAMDYLEKIILDCKERGIEVLLVTLPFPATELQHAAANTAFNIADEFDLNYINFLDMDVVNYDVDCYDSNSHLNPSGARKVTDYLGNYITENYDIADHRADTSYSDWYDDYALYRDYKIDNLKDRTSLDLYLMLLADKNFETEFEFFDYSLLESDYYCELLENLGIDTASVTEGAGAEDVALAITVRDIETGEVVDKVDVSSDGTVTHV